MFDKINLEPLVGNLRVVVVILFQECINIKGRIGCLDFEIELLSKYSFFVGF